MKKIYLLAFGLISVAATAQFTEDFDDLAPGNVSSQSPYIIVWPDPSVTDAQVTTDQAKSAPHSMWIRSNHTDDVLVQLGNQNSDVWSVTFDLYVPSGSTGFWNVQNNEEANPAQWNGQFFVDVCELTSGPFGVPGAITTDMDNGLTQVPYPNDTWFNVTHVVDFSGSDIMHIVMVNGEELYNGQYVDGQTGDPTPATHLGAINFYSIDTQASFYVDDFRLIEGNILSTPDLALNSFKVYPNPVVDVLTISSNEIVQNVNVYNILGQLVNQVTPNVASPTVDFSTLKSGVYFVEVTINGQVQTVQVIK